MIRTLSGTIALNDSRGLVIETAGVGYFVAVPARALKPAGAMVRFFTYHHIKEDGQALYGFETMEELKVFESLLTVQSIGPRLAMAILDKAAPNEISAAIESQDVAFFQSIPGLGKKSALKILIELKNKLTDVDGTVISSSGQTLVDALASLGYQAGEIQQIVKQVPNELVTLEEQTSWALRALAR